MTTKRNKGVGNKKGWAKEMKQRPCHYCGTTPAGTIDHVIPLSEGGPTTPANCVPACDPCNQKRMPKKCWSMADKLVAALSTPQP